MKAGKKLIYGVGINDADYNVNMIENGKRVRCVFYTQWKNMMARCYGKSTHKNQPTYVECSVDSRWHSFMIFKSWMETQDWKGKALDKDILFEGNKVYSPDTCMFVSRDVNNFFSPQKSKDLPLGVQPYGKCGKRYSAKIKTLGSKVQVCLGIFDCQYKAYDAYLKAKSQAAIHLANEQSDKRISDAIIKRFVTNPA